MLRLLPEYHDSHLIRSRDPARLSRSTSGKFKSIYPALAHKPFASKTSEGKWTFDVIESKENLVV